jgi:hydroxypyruvate reductase
MAGSPERLHADARDIFSAGLAGVDSRAAVERVLAVEGAEVVMRDPAAPRGRGEHRWRVSGVRVVGAGKAAGLMTRAAERILGPLVRGGACVTGESAPLRAVSLLRGGHPLPDEGSLEAGRRVVEEVRRTAPDELLLVLLSGGASAMLEGLVEGLSLHDLRALTERLLNSGAPIEEINTVRRALSTIKGGGLLLEVPEGGQAAVLVLSDVLGSPLASIGSGPMWPQPARADDALAVLEARGLARGPAREVLLRRAAEDERRARRLREKGSRVVHLIVGDNRQMVDAAERLARLRGYRTLVLTTFLEGEARQVGVMLGAVAREIRASGRPLAGPACVLCSGETTVTVVGRGRGGRNQETALGFALAAAGLSRTVLLCAASDGIDGPTDAAGAAADGQTTARARTLGLDARGCLDDNDAYRFFEALGDLLVTGPTGTNTNDLMVLLVGATS